MTPELVVGLFDPARLARDRLDAAMVAACPDIWSRCVTKRGGIGRRALHDRLVGGFGEALKISWAECLRRGRRGNTGRADWPVKATFRPLIEVFDGRDAWLAMPVGIEVTIHKHRWSAPGSALDVHVELGLAIGHGADPRAFHHVEADIVLPRAVA
jgi:hypothetical protein